MREPVVNGHVPEDLEQKMRRRIPGRSRPTGARLAPTVLVLALRTAATPALAQPAPPEPPLVPLDTATLAQDPRLIMETLLEKTIFKVDVLRLRVRFGPATASELRRLVAGGSGSATTDSIAAVALASTDAWARIRFERDVALSQFLNGVMENLERAVAAQMVPQVEYDRLDANLPRWFGFLRERRIRDGDQLWYRIRGDTLRTLYVGVAGEVLLDQTDVGPGPRLAVLGGYLAPGSDLRDGLIESLFESPGDSDR